MRRRWRLKRFWLRQYRLCRRVGYSRSSSRIVASLDVQMLRDHMGRGLAS